MRKENPTIVDTSLDWTNEAPSPLFRTSPRPMPSTVEILNQRPVFNLVSVGESSLNALPLASFGFLGCSAVVVKDLQSTTNRRSLSHIWHGTSDQDLDMDEYAEDIVGLFGSKTRELVAAIISSGETKKLESSLKREGIIILEKLEIEWEKSDRIFGSLRDVVVFPERGKITVNTKHSGVHVVSF